MSKQRKIKKANSEDKDKVVRLVLCNLCKYFWRMNHNTDDSFLNPGFSDMLLFEFTGTVLYKLQTWDPKGDGHVDVVKIKRKGTKTDKQTLLSPFPCAQNSQPGMCARLAAETWEIR